MIFAGVHPDDALAKNSGPSDGEVAERVAKLLGHGDDASSQPSAEEDPLDETRGLWDDSGEGDEQDNSAEDEPSDRPEVRIQLPKLPRIIAQIAPKDIADMLREIRGEARQDSEDEGQSGGQDEAAA